MQNRFDQNTTELSEVPKFIQSIISQCKFGLPSVLESAICKAIDFRHNETLLLRKHIVNLIKAHSRIKFFGIFFISL